MSVTFSKTTDLTMRKFNDTLVSACNGCAVNEPHAPVTEENAHEPGWPCASCFYGGSEKFNRTHWHTLRWYGYEQMTSEEGLTDLPATIAEREKILLEIYQECSGDSREGQPTKKPRTGS
jgi:hypothetical protein